nr:PREDICTED: protein DEFECTIVE IN MERISTEM SILENCING 3-like [Daucus carota subsp. sativus]
MLALVCQTFDGVKALEAYDEGGVINRNSGLHGIASSIGRTLEGRFHVICLDELISGLLNPKLPGGEIPCGFIGYAVNLKQRDYQNLSWVTTSGHGLRETLFYHLFSLLQVYRTMKDMYKALPFIKDGAVSLDGGIMSPGVFDLGHWVFFCITFKISSY